MEEAKSELPPDIYYANNIDDAITGADAIVLLTEGKEFRGMNLKNALELMKGDVFVDLRIVYDPEPMRAMEFQYSCVGR